MKSNCQPGLLSNVFLCASTLLCLAIGSGCRSSGASVSERDILACVQAAIRTCPNANSYDVLVRGDKVTVECTTGSGRVVARVSRESLDVSTSSSIGRPATIEFFDWEELEARTSLLALDIIAARVSGRKKRGFRMAFSKGVVKLNRHVAISEFGGEGDKELLIFDSKNAYVSTAYPH